MPSKMHPEIVAFWEQRGEHIVSGTYPYPDNNNHYWTIGFASRVSIAFQYRDSPISYRLLPDYTWMSEGKMLRLIKLRAFL